MYLYIHILIFNIEKKWPSNMIASWGRQLVHFYFTQAAILSRFRPINYNGMTCIYIIYIAPAHT